MQSRTHGAAPVIAETTSPYRLPDRLSEIKALRGPSTTHQVDELAAALFAEASNFAPVAEAIRRSAQVIIRRGARWLQFRPIVPIGARDRKDPLRASAC